MKIEIVETQKVKKTVDIKLPYYFKHDLMLDESDTIIYGKLEEKTSTTITLRSGWRDEEIQSAEIEIETINWASSSCYLKDEYKSGESEYLEAKQKALSLMEKA